MTYDDIALYLSAKSVLSKCEVCGQDQGWKVRGATEEDGTYSIMEGLTFMKVQEDSELARPQSAGRPTVIIECKNCGNFRLFNYTKIEQWAQEKRQAEND